MADQNELDGETDQSSGRFAVLNRADGILAGLVVGAFLLVAGLLVWGNDYLKLGVIARLVWCLAPLAVAGWLGYRASPRYAPAERGYVFLNRKTRWILAGSVWLILAVGVSFAVFGTQARVAAVIAAIVLFLLGVVGVIFLSLNSITFASWLYRDPWTEEDEPADEQIEYFMTGPDLIERVARAISLNQSVILAGPRGCGKSYCIQQAINLAGRRGIIKPGAYRFLQGNREVPRDYLVEDEIAFRTKKGQNGAEDQVLPYRRPAPLFSFAKRDGEEGNPLSDPVSGMVICQFKPTEPIPKFVLFLDEINRFSDGVLDSLLSVLEERKAVLAGIEYRLPVVVCMTMNPPGYDATARKLSPPLAARISRSYRLFTPDLDTLSDLVIRFKLKEAAKQYEADTADRRAAEPLFPVIADHLIRRAALASLCLWGDIRVGPGETPKPGNDYLTADTKRLLLSFMNKNPHAARAMKTLAGLCQFGPDGRAAADWMITAIGQALDDARVEGVKNEPAVLRPVHLKRSVIQSVAHKIYDSFSEGSRPDLAARKEQMVRTICDAVFELESNDELISRLIDQPTEMAVLSARLGLNYEGLKELLLDSQVTADHMVRPWLNIAREYKDHSGAGQDEALFEQLVLNKLVVREDGDGLLPGFIDARQDVLARKLQDVTMPAKGAAPSAAAAPVTGWARQVASWQKSGSSPLALGLRSLFDGNPKPRIGPVRQPLLDVFANKPVFRLLGRDRLEKLLDAPAVHVSHQTLSLLLETVECVWDFQPGSEDADAGGRELAGSVRAILQRSKLSQDETSWVCQRLIQIEPTLSDRAARYKPNQAYYLIEAFKRAVELLRSDAPVVDRPETFGEKLRAAASGATPAKPAVAPRPPSLSPKPGVTVQPSPPAKKGAFADALKAKTKED